MLCSFLQGNNQRCTVICLGNTLGRTCLGRLYKYRIRKLCFDAGCHLVDILQLFCQHRHINSLTDSKCINDQLSIELIHRCSRSEHTTSDIWDICHLEQSLNRSILAIHAMQDREDHINRLHLHHIVLRNDKSALCIRGNDCRNGTLLPTSVFDACDIFYKLPLTVFCNSDQEHIVFLKIYCFGNCNN